MMDASKLHEYLEYKDGLLYWKVDRQRKTSGKVAGCKRKDGYYEVKIFGKSMLLHRIVYAMFHGEFPSMIDHIDGDVSNNSIDNLRPCKSSSNQMNRKANANSRTGVKGVYMDGNKYRVAIQVDNKRLRLGYYDDVELAELVAIEARNKYHGDFARHA